KDRSVPWPITTGVPFPQGALKNAEQCRLVDDRGEVCRLQTKVAATWDAAKTSIRWLTIDFIAQPGRKYALEFGEDVPRRRMKWSAASRKTDNLGLGAGPLRADFTSLRAGHSGLESISYDFNGDGMFSQSEVVVKGSEHVFATADGKIFS